MPKSIPVSMHESVKRKALIAAQAALDKRAENIVILDLMSLAEESGISSVTDAFLICSGASERQVQSIAEEIAVKLKALFGSARLEGQSEAQWIVVDAGDIVCHVFLDHVREYYDLEGAWAEAERIAVPEELYTNAAPKPESRNPLSPSFR